MRLYAPTTPTISTADLAMIETELAAELGPIRAHHVVATVDTGELVVTVTTGDRDHRGVCRLVEALLYGMNPTVVIVAAS